MSRTISTCFTFSHRSAAKLSRSHLPLQQPLLGLSSPVSSARHRFTLHCSDSSGLLSKDDGGGIDEPTSRPWWSSKHDKFAFPILLANMTIPLTSLVDSAVVGRVGTAELSGVGMGMAIVAMTTTCLNFIGIVVTPFVGEKYVKKSAKRVLKPAPEIKPFAIQYAKLLGLCIPFYTSQTACLGAARGIKRPDWVLKATIVITIVNCVLDIVLVFGFGMSVSGAAIATVGSTVVSLVYIMQRLVSKKVLSLSDLRQIPPLRRFLQMASEGSRVSLRSLFLWANLTVASILPSRKGSVVHSAFEISRITTMLLLVLAITTEQTTSALVAMEKGKNRINEAREIAIRNMQISLGVSGLVVATLLPFTSEYARMFVTDPDVIALFVKTAPVAFIPLAFQSAIGAVDGALFGFSLAELVALSYSFSYSIGIVAMLILHNTGMLNLLTAFALLRMSSILGGCINTFVLFFRRSSPFIRTALDE